VYLVASVGDAERLRAELDSAPDVNGAQPLNVILVAGTDEEAGKLREMVAFAAADMAPWSGGALVVLFDRLTPASARVGGRER
jgi:hypothetical protein